MRVPSPRECQPVLRAVVLVLVALLLDAGVAGCTSVNAPLNPPDVPVEQRARNRTRATIGVNVSPPQSSTMAPVVTTPPDGDVQPTRDGAIRDADGCFVGLALSGGGSRSANFSAACMFELQRLGLLDHVDYISTVSGGSLTGAYYCVSDRTAWNPGNVQRKLTHAFASDVILCAMLPWNTVWLLLTDWDRTDLLADSFGRTLFSRDGRALTFADLRDDRPHLLINATDLQSGRPFVFCDESFDQLNSDLARYPLASAVAASAAVPVVMHQVTIRDYSTSFKQFRHLIDGGINDNLGITTLVEAYDAQVRAAISAGQPSPYPRGAVLFVIDARTRFDARLDDKGDIGLIESLSAGAGLTSSQLLNRVSSATMAEIIVRYSPDEVTAGTLRSQIAALEKTGYLELRDRRGQRVIVAHLALSRVADLSEVPSQGFFQRLNNIATYFNITDDEAAGLYKGAELLVHEKFEADLRRIADDLNRP